MVDLKRQLVELSAWFEVQENQINNLEMQVKILAEMLDKIDEVYDIEDIAFSVLEKYK